jgi:hypothetical protein
MNELPGNGLQSSAPALFETSGGVVLLIVGLVAALFVGYLVFDWIRGWRALRRLEYLRRKNRPIPSVLDTH